MNKTVVVYQSTYGTTKSYAELIAQELGADLMDCKQAKRSVLIGYDTIIFGGGIYAGRIAGSGLIRRNYESLAGKRFVVFSVGFTPQQREDVLERVKNSSFNGLQTDNIRFFHFRGGVEYNKLNLFHRMLFSIKRRMISMQPKNKRTEDNKRFLNQYGKNVKIALDSPQPLIAYMKERIE